MKSYIDQSKKYLTSVTFGITLPDFFPKIAMFNTATTGDMCEVKTEDLLRHRTWKIRESWSAWLIQLYGSDLRNVFGDGPWEQSASCSIVNECLALLHENLAILLTSLWKVRKLLISWVYIPLQISKLGPYFANMTTFSTEFLCSILKTAATLTILAARGSMLQKSWNPVAMGPNKNLSQFSKILTSTWFLSSFYDSIDGASVEGDQGAVPHFGADGDITDEILTSITRKNSFIEHTGRNKHC